MTMHADQTGATTRDDGGFATAAAAGALLLAAAIAIGALGEHTLSGRLPAERLDTLATAARYQVYGALGLVLCAALGQNATPRRAALLRVAVPLLLVGMALFCGALYGLVAGGPGWLGAVAPLGGAGQIAAWLVVAAAYLRR